MAGSAAHLVDRVLPSVPLRQYVLAFPYELSGLAATRPDVLAALSRIFWESLRLRYQGWAKAAGHATSPRVETGAVTGVHRAGASLNVHVHFHLLCLDGVYFDDGETLRFEPAPAPTRAELASMLQRIYARVMKWLSRRGLLRNPADADVSNAPPEVSPAEALATAGIVRERDDGADEDEPALATTTPPRLTDAVTHERFNLHASVHLAAHDDLGRERLCRYLTRPAFSLARLRVRRDGNVSYRVKKATRGRVTQPDLGPAETTLAATPPPPSPRGLEAGDGRAALVLTAATIATATLTTTGAAVHVAPNVLSIAHWDRLLEGELYASSSRLDWRTLLKRTFDIDLRVCVCCGGRLTVRALVTAPASVAKMLAALRRPRAPPAAA